jgi:hypothetical protein
MLTIAYKAFTNHLIGLIAGTLFIISAINFVIDPGEIYLRSYLSKYQSKQLADKILSSKFGVVQEGWNERLVKVALSKRSGKFDCIVIGSSHVMQISSVTSTKIRGKCPLLLNLGVSGGSIEDIAIFVKNILDSSKKPKIIFIGIDPWTLKFNMDTRWAQNKIIYDEFVQSFSAYINDENANYTYKLLTNLINREYFFSSLISLWNNHTSLFNSPFASEIILAEKFNYLEGYEKAVTLRDGSHIYSKKHIQTHTNTKPDKNSGSYKISGAIYEMSAINFLKGIVRMLQSKNTEVSFLLTPYHPEVFINGHPKAIKHITVMQDLTEKMAKELSIHLSGSYFPNELNCTADEFYDFMHAKISCLEKIDF